jgi:hypothetical protein
MRKAMLLTLAMVTLMVGTAWAQTGGVTGNVVGRDGAVVEGARVSLWLDGDCQGYVLSDADGVFTFTDVEVGVYELRAGMKKIGNAYIDGVEVLEGEVTDVGTLTLAGKNAVAIPRF